MNQIFEKGWWDMIKGCKKSVVYVRNTESDVFEEAYFILSDDYEVKQPTEPDMVAEANRIISESPIASYFGMSAEKQKRKRGGNCSVISRGLWFVAGALFSSGIALLLSVL